MDNTYFQNISFIEEQQEFFLSILKEELHQSNDTTHDQMLILLNKLEEYFTYLFSIEENLMNHFKTIKHEQGNSEFANIDVHKQQHLFCIQRIKEMKLGLSYDNKLLHGKLMNFLKKWYLTHILQFDKTLTNIICDSLNTKEKQNEAE